MVKNVQQSDACSDLSIGRQRPIERSLATKDALLRAENAACSK